MNPEELETIRNKYITMKKQNKRITDLKDEIAYLEKDAKVKRYLEIVKYKNLFEISENIMLENAFKKTSKNTKESNKIYVYMGTVDNLNLYKDLETEEYIKINVYNYEFFENSNTVISVGGKQKSSEFHEKLFKNIQKEFREELLYFSQSEVKENLILRYQKKYL